MDVRMKKSITVILGILLTVACLKVGISAGADGPSISLRQAGGTVRLGAIEFSPPQGFWYNPPDSYPSSTSLAVTFYKTKNDATLMQDDPSPARDPIVVVRVAPNSFGDFDSYYRAESQMYRTKGLEGLYYYKDLPHDIKSLFEGLPSWRCREKVNRGYPELTAVDCLALNHRAVLISAFCFDEKKVLDMAPTLKSMMMSVKGR